jgi:flavin reductase (DIM6/NTAB) family NADH-FMN oxidoreductase RutF
MSIGRGVRVGDWCCPAQSGYQPPGDRAMARHVTDLAQAEPGDLAIGGDVFRRVLGHYPTGVCIVAALDADGQGGGLTIGSFTSVSLDPPLVAFCPDRKSRSWARIRSAPAFAVNILASDQETLCRRFSAATEDKLAGVAHRRSPLGAPLLDGVVAWIECVLEAEHEAGDHFIVVGRVSALAVERAVHPLLFFRGGYGDFAPFVPGTE